MSLECGNEKVPCSASGEPCLGHRNRGGCSIGDGWRTSVGVAGLGR